MNKDKLILIATTAIIVVCLFFMLDRKGTGELLGESKKEEEGLKKKEKLERLAYEIDDNLSNKAANFSLSNLHGEKISLDQYRGKLVFINFWVTWSQGARDELMDLEKLEKNEEDIKVLCINVREDKELIENFIEDNDLDLEILLDENGEIGLDYLIGRLPTTYIVDRKGNLVKKIIGPMTYEEMTYEAENNL